MTSVERRSSSSGVSDGSEAFVLVRGRAGAQRLESRKNVDRVSIVSIVSITYCLSPDAARTEHGLSTD